MKWRVGEVGRRSADSSSDTLSGTGSVAGDDDDDDDKKEKNKDHRQ